MSDQTRNDPSLFTFFNEIGILEQLTRSALERQLPHGLKVSQFGVLNHFVRLGGERSPLQLASAFQVTKGAMTNTVARLETLGFIHVRPDPKDGRAKLVSISEDGIKARNEAVSSMSPMLQQLMEEFPEEEFLQALPFLQKLRIYLDEKRF